MRESPQDSAGSGVLGGIEAGALCHCSALGGLYCVFMRLDETPELLVSVSATTAPTVLSNNTTESFPSAFGKSRFMCLPRLSLQIPRQNDYGH